MFLSYSVIRPSGDDSELSIPKDHDTDKLPNRNPYYSQATGVLVAQIFTLWLFNRVMENGPFIDVF